MSKPLCPKCGNNTFTATNEPVENLNIPVVFIQCKSCGSIVGTSESHLIDMVKDLAHKLKIRL